jgi:Secretin and TonB N terminus short domain/TonB C terminal
MAQSNLQVGFPRISVSIYFPSRRGVMIASLWNYEADRPLLVAACAFLVGWCVHVVGATEPQPGSPPTLMRFEIQAQPLATALQAYGQRTGVQVLYESRSADGRQSTAVEGEFTPGQALNLLLSGTGLDVHYARPDAITLAPPSIRGADEPPSDPLVNADFSIGELRVRASGQRADLALLQDYNASVQADIETALQKNSRTRSGSYRAVMDLWISTARVIQKAALLQSTGDGDKDAAVVTALNGLTISRPTPPNVPQPVRVAIIVTGSQ